MNINQHGENLIQLGRFGSAFNAYFVKEDDGLTLIDAGLPGSAKGILRAAEQSGLPITRIALTHSHVDHIGALDALAATLPGVEVLVSAREARLMAGDLSLDADEANDKLRGGYVQPKTQPTRTLQAGDRVGSLEVIAAPGHTPGQIAFMDTRDGTLIAGDAFQSQGGIAVAGQLRLLFPFPGFAYWHKVTSLNTAQALYALKPSRLAVGHGNVLENPAQMMQQAIESAERNLRKQGSAASLAL